MVILIIGLLTAAGILSLSKSAKKTNRENVANEYQLFATGLSDAYYDLGAPDIAPNSPNAVDEFKKYLQNIQSDYVALTFDMDTIKTTSTGFEVEVAAPLDVYETRYKCWFVTDASTMKYVMVASGGDNGVIDSTGYENQDYGDDIVLIVRPKT